MRSGDPILLPLTYLGPVSYFAAILRAGRVTFELHEHYIKQTCRNRCTIMSANGVLNLIIPVVKVNGNHTAMKDMQISNQGKWQLMHWRAIAAAYSNSPFFLYYREDFEPFFRGRPHLLSDFSASLTNVVLGLLGIDEEMDYTEGYEKNAESGIADLRNTFGAGERRLFHFPEYPQVFDDRHGFQADLSVIDLLFNLGPDARHYLMDLKLATP